MTSSKLLTEDVETEKNKNKIDLDTILVEEIGQFGPFQLRILFLTSILVLFRSWSTSEYVFTTGKISTRCYIPGCDSNNDDYSPEWLLSAIPSAGGVDNCHRYANITELPTNGTCSAQMFNSSHIQPCDAFVYENTNTVVYDFGLACDEWRRTLIGSARGFGMFAALPITGYISDRWGRRTALGFNTFNAAWLGTARYFTTSYTGFLVSEIVESTFSGGIYSCANVIAMEILGPKYRVVGSLFTNTFLSLGKISIAFIGMAVPNWRMFIISIYTPQFISIVIVLLMSESVRWSMSKGRYNQVKSLLKKIAKVNNKNISPETLEGLRLTYIEQKKKEEEEKDKKTEWLIVQVYKNKRILLISTVTAFCWMSKSFAYVGLSINATTISGNPYLNYAAASAVEIPGYWLGIYLLNKVGRKPVLIGAFFTCAACQVAYIFISKEMFAISLTIFLIGKFTTGMLLLSSVIYTTELYPTQQRQRLVSFAAIMGSLGATIAPLTPAFGAATFAELPFVLFGSMALIAGLLIMLLPETLNAKLADTMQETLDLKLNTQNTQPLLTK